ncbi:MAG: hypothetical protein FWG66_16120 [Spirochaetes bacterium]|nr:hypothetical protein [Spirochaetota bacterium]
MVIRSKAPLRLGLAGGDKANIDKTHIGIISMKERAAILGGSLKIISAPEEAHWCALKFRCFSVMFIT